MNEQLQFVMDETGRPFEPGDPRYDKAVNRTPEQISFDNEIIRKYGLADTNKDGCFKQ